jgi:hypothetical protein
MSRTCSMNSGSLDSLKVSGAVGVQRESPPDPADRALGHARSLGHGAGAPMGGPDRGALEGQGDDPLDVGVCDLARSTRPGLIEKSVETPLTEPGAPLADHLLGYTHFLPDDGVGLALGTRQN